MIIQKENYISEENYSYLLNYLSSTNDWEELKNNPLWNKRCINPFGIQNKETLDVMYSIHNNLREDIKNTFNPESEIYSELFQFCRSYSGVTGDPHSDSTGNNGEDNGTGYRRFSSIIYLGGDFEGGNLWFPNQQKTIIPTPKSAAMFPSTFEYMHGVTEIFSGMRYTLLSFWTYDYNKAHSQKFFDERYSNGN